MPPRPRQTRPLLRKPLPFKKPPQPGALEAAPVTIQIFYPVAVDAPIAKILQGFADGFSAENPNITVEPVFSGGYNDVRNTINTTVQGGGTPPALAVLLATDLYDLVNADLISPLDPYITDKAALDQFEPAFMANSSYNGQVWSIPFQRSLVALYYNADLFAAAGLSAPDSWDALATDAQALTVKDGDTVTRWGILWPTSWPYWTFQPLAIGAGQNVIDPAKDTEVFFNTPAVVDSIQFINDLSAKYGATPAGVQDNWGSAPGDFASGAAAMIVHSSGSLTGILSQADFKVGVMALPGKTPGTYATVTGGGNLSIMKGVSEEQKAAAWKFIEYLTRPENVASFSQATGYIPYTQAAFDAEADYLAAPPRPANCGMP